MVNVPTGVLIDENGQMVRYDEGVYTQKYKAGALEFGTDLYLPALRDWVAEGAASRYVLSPQELAAKRPRPNAQVLAADAAFRLAAYFHQAGDAARAERYWREAQEKNPDSWNYARQEWSIEPAEHLRKWREKFEQLAGRPYYAPIELPQP